MYLVKKSVFLFIYLPFPSSGIKMKQKKIRKVITLLVFLHSRNISKAKEDLGVAENLITRFGSVRAWLDLLQASFIFFFQVTNLKCVFTIEAGSGSSYEQPRMSKGVEGG